MSGNWMLTNMELYQICRKIDEGVYELYQIEDCGENCVVCHEVICTDDIDVQGIVICYGYDSEQQMRDQYGDDFERELAECEFELRCGCFDNIVCRMEMDFDHAAELIQTMSGFGGER